MIASENMHQDHSSVGVSQKTVLKHFTIYLLKVNNRNIRARCEIRSKLTKNIAERRHKRRSGVFIVNFEHISRFFLLFLLLTLNM